MTPLRIFFENNDLALNLNLKHPLPLMKLEYFFVRPIKINSST